MLYMLKTVSLAILAAGAAQAGELDGQWSRGDGKAKVVIAPCGENLCATNTWVRPGTPKEKAGDVLVMSLKPVDGQYYEGTAFDPQRDLTYRMRVTVQGDRMDSRGCVLAGLLCKGMGWTRID